jgi:WD repeat-containing protein 19
MLVQELFLKSSAPRAALEMRVDLKHWQEALRLAQQMDPEAVPVICKEQAQMMEVVGDYQQARSYYQQVRPVGCVCSCGCN